MFAGRRVSLWLPGIALVLLAVGGCQDSPLPTQAEPDGPAFAKAGGGPSFTIVRESGKYKNVGIGWTWDEAEALARTIRSRGRYGYLATILSEAENNAVHALMKDQTGCWIGLRQTSFDDEPHGGWEWVTGEALDYANWGDGEPNDWGESEHYAEIVRYESSSTWNDNDGSRGRDCLVVRFDP